MRKLYVLSKAIEGKPFLIGELSEENGEYRFEYKLGGYFPRWYLQLDEFPQADKVYRGEEVRPFVEKIVPKRDSVYIDCRCIIKMQLPIL
jgi:hypothetical protein